MKMKIAIVSGKDEGPTRLNAFDNALTDAGIGDVNLIKVSSMLEKIPELKNCQNSKPELWLIVCFLQLPQVNLEIQ